MRAWDRWLPEVRWATAATVCFGLGLVVHLTGGPEWPLMLACYLAGGWEPAWSGMRALWNRSLDVDLLMVVAAVGAAAIGQVLDGGLLIVIFAVSGAVEAVATHRTAASVRGLLDLAPERATLLTDAGEHVVDAGSLDVGDRILVRPGERIGADGAVVDGASDVDQSTVTGEGLPVAKGPGDEVFAGTTNTTGALRVRVSRPAHESVVARIAAMVARAAESKAGTQLFIEKIEQRYSVGMVAATLAVFVVPLLFGADLDAALLRAMTFMIVASPCAVVLATMPPLLAAMANAGRHGVLVKSAVVMEQLGRTTRVAFDKTGTLTLGAPAVAQVRVLPDAGLGAAELLLFASAAEHPSEHPLGRAVVEAALGMGVSPRPVERFSSVPGRGVSAWLDGRFIEVGRPTRLEDDRVTEVVVELEAAGHTVVVVRLDGRPVGALGLADRVRPGGAEVVGALGAHRPVLVTGDNVRAAHAVAAEVGITDVRAGLLPEDKVAVVRDLRARGERVLVVGDGVNDAPALAEAQVGVAMGRAGSDLALDAADVVIVRDELAAVPALIELSRRARRLVIANLLIAAVFIAGLALWDLLGTLPLPLGVLGHEGSTVIVGLNGLRLLSGRAWPRIPRRRDPVRDAEIAMSQNKCMRSSP
ncbi:heavy metal translocating P-type ATPase [Pseudonocardia spinosispora]|uniref:heavy metal translocating P-type ATPase n=1 Tax=Pseudonocardia spinosispora TaxID=103441 RepID=UPI000A02C841|nr:heavy metal translocating P-type ATPase [Pseudonocardia spinosispora]